MWMKRKSYLSAIYFIHIKRFQESTVTAGSSSMVDTPNQELVVSSGASTAICLEINGEINEMVNKIGQNERPQSLLGDGQGVMIFLN